MDINGVKMMPSGLVTCLVEGREVRVIELSGDAFKIRLAEKLEVIQKIQLNFFHFRESRYEEVVLQAYELLEVEEESYYVVYTIGTNQTDYQRNATAVIRSYTDYIMLKMTGDDGYCSEEMAGYPAALDEEYASDFESQKKEWFQQISEKRKSAEWDAEFEFSVSIDNRLRYQQYMQQDIHSFMMQLLKENYLEQHPIVRKEVQRVYLGNQFCHNLFPELNHLLTMMDKAHSEGLAITIVTTYLREEQIPKAEELVNEILCWCNRNQTMVEMVINDWGMAKILENRTDWIQPVLGILLNKRRKDPRYQYKSGFEPYKEQLAQNNLGSREYRKFLLDSFGINRYEYEACRYPLELPVHHNSLHFPYYQTNTSQYCTLYAKCANGDRGQQEFVRNCPYYCEDIVFSYPKHLKLVGRYNSLFALDDGILQDASQLLKYIENGIDRLVLTLL